MSLVSVQLTLATHSGDESLIHAYLNSTSSNHLPRDENRQACRVLRMHHNARAEDIERLVDCVVVDLQGSGKQRLECCVHCHEQNVVDTVVIHKYVARRSCVLIVEDAEVLSVCDSGADRTQAASELLEGYVIHCPTYQIVDVHV